MSATMEVVPNCYTINPDNNLTAEKKKHLCHNKKKNTKIEEKTRLYVE